MAMGVLGRLGPVGQGDCNWGVGREMGRAICLRSSRKQGREAADLPRRRIGGGDLGVVGQKDWVERGGKTETV